jgi:hypothetical protein
MYRILTGNFWRMSTEAVLLVALLLGTGALAFSAYSTQASLLLYAFVLVSVVSVL